MQQKKFRISASLTLRITQILIKYIVVPYMKYLNLQLDKYVPLNSVFEG